MMFKQPVKIEFINEMAGVAELMPMIPAKELRHPWVDRAIQEYSQLRKSPQWYNRKNFHTAKCPGIFPLQRHGWIMRTWQDIVITTQKSDNTNFSWSCARNQNHIEHHAPNHFADYWQSWPENTLRTVIKINSGWSCVVPKGYYLYEMAIPLSEENRFTAVPGYFSHEIGIAHMNVQLLWHVMDGETLIKAGTPVAQYILVPKEQPEMICRDADKYKDKLHLFELYDTTKFIRSYHEIKKLFSQK